MRLSDGLPLYQDGLRLGVQGFPRVPLHRRDEHQPADGTRWHVMSETKQEEKKKEQSQGELQLTYDPENPDPHRRRGQIAVPGGKEKKKKETGRSTAPV